MHGREGKEGKGKGALKRKMHTTPKKKKRVRRMRVLICLVSNNFRRIRLPFVAYELREQSIQREELQR